MQNFDKYAHIPLKQKSNRVWRTYTGGAMIDRWKLTSPEQDGSFPEEWIMSTISARGKGRPEAEGLSVVQTPEGEMTLKELIDSNPELYLGKTLAEKFGTTGVLIKMLDSRERLTIQVHPDKKYAREMLNSPFGKTESWYVLNCRSIDGVDSAVYMGFKEGVTKEKWRTLFEEQDIRGMLDALHRFEVAPGDAFMIYGGVPHAIGSGCFLLEVQEPTDFTMRTEKVTPAGLEISDELIHQGVGEKNMLDCFHYDACSKEEALKKWKVTPQIVEKTEDYELRTVFNETHTDCFGVSELLLNGAYTRQGNDGFFVVVIYAGSGSILCNGNEYPYAQGDEIFFSAAIEEVGFKSSEDSKLLLCYPPK